jgi:hypothetical protein
VGGGLEKSGKDALMNKNLKIVYISLQNGENTLS